MVKENPERKGKEGGRRERKRKGTWIVIAKTKPKPPLTGTPGTTTLGQNG